jgi:50S ribosomal protein L16 3-hydroxylase
MLGRKPPLGEISLEHFMRVHWQRRPLLVRNAFPGFRSPVPPQRLFDLAAQDDVESRLVSSARGRWALRHGPFETGELPLAARRDWTLLVQGVDLHLDEIHSLLGRFRFVADARLDDLMISYAVDGGGVGPHVDSYDVFLLQAHGRRRWRIGWPRSSELLSGVPMKILARFEPTDEYVLEAGDMLYLPPGWAHEGTAVGECMTFSVGFRAPSRHELLGAWFAECADSPPSGPDPRYSDRGTGPTRTPGRLPEPMHAVLAKWLREWRPAPREIDRFMGRFLTEPKPNVWFQAPRRRTSPAAFTARALGSGLRVDRRSRLAYRRRDFFINGEHLPMTAKSAPLLRRLADERSLPPDALGGTSVDPELISCLRQWFDAGWIRFGPP